MVHVNIFYKIYNSNTSKENNLNKTNIRKIFSFLFKSLFFGNNAVEVECISSGFSTKIEEGKQRLVTKKRGICQSLWLWFCLHYGFHWLRIHCRPGFIGYNFVNPVSEVWNPWVDTRGPDLGALVAPGNQSIHRPVITIFAHQRGTRVTLY